MRSAINNTNVKSLTDSHTDLPADDCKIDRSLDRNQDLDNNPEFDHSLDRNFDPIADHFSKKVYGGLKGDIRLAVLRRDIHKSLASLSKIHQRPLRILDVGAGLAQLSLELAIEGHDITINDMSKNMIQKAQNFLKNRQSPNHADNYKENYKDSTQNDLNKAQSANTNITWHVCPYQTLDSKLTGKYDLIMCHALLEWLGQPNEIMAFFKHWLSDEGLLSLCFYNPASFVYRNLIMGNFNLLNNPNYKADNIKSLTPNNPVSFDEVKQWLTQIDYSINTVSGLRVFHDYTPLKRGGLNDPKAVIDMELRYSTQDPYRWLGRYLHVMASPNLL